MPDLGLYNFIHNEMVKGRSKDEIVAQLAEHGHSPEAIETAYLAAKHNRPPRPPPVTAAGAPAAVAPYKERWFVRAVKLLVLCAIFAFLFAGALFLLDTYVLSAHLVYYP